MKKSFLILALLGSMTSLADADSYLYWMIDTSSSYSYAKIRDQTTPNTYLTIYNDLGVTAVPDGTQVAKTYVDDAAAWGEGFYVPVDSVNGTPATFIVELFNSDNKFVSQSVLSYNSDYVYGGGMGLPPSSAMTFSSFAIPEPSSGLLMLVGCAVLGLRRRKQKNA